MVCRNCGEVLPEETVLCPQCGEPTAPPDPELAKREDRKRAVFRAAAPILILCFLLFLILFLLAVIQQANPKPIPDGDSGTTVATGESPVSGTMPEDVETSDNTEAVPDTAPALDDNGYDSNAVIRNPQGHEYDYGSVPARNPSPVEEESQTAPEGEWEYIPVLPPSDLSEPDYFEGYELDGMQ